MMKKFYLLLFVAAAVAASCGKVPSSEPTEEPTEEPEEQTGEQSGEQPDQPGDESGEPPVVDYVVPEGSVDLGLSVCWGTCNVGASTPDEYGGIYTWAGLTDVTSGSYYLDWTSCPYHDGDSPKTGWTKYVPEDFASCWSGPGNADNKLVLDPEDDVAHVELGEPWRMPTDDEWQELIDNCTWTPVVEGRDVYGVTVTSNVPGFTDKSIYLRAAGSREQDFREDRDHFCSYWASTLRDVTSAYGILYADGALYGHFYVKRYGGQSVRPVADKQFLHKH